MSSSQSQHRQVLDVILDADISYVLDAIEVIIDGLDRIVDDPDRPLLPRNAAIKRLNQRFFENGVGFQLEGREFVRSPHIHLHEAVTRPAFKLLSEEAFDGASEEFYEAHMNFREGRNNDAIATALKAVESTLKTICDEFGWEYGNRPTASSLITVVHSNDLFPSYLKSHMEKLVGAMISGVPSVRNQPGAGHGQGSTPIVIPDYLAAHALHLSAANIVFLVECYKEKKRSER